MRFAALRITHTSHTVYRRVYSPGRFFAANELKCMMAHIVHAYDVKLEKEGEIPQPEWFTYAVSPNRNAEVLFRKRQT